MDVVTLDLRNEIEDVSLTGIAPTRDCREEAFFDAISLRDARFDECVSPGAGTPSLSDKSNPIADAFTDKCSPIR